MMSSTARGSAPVDCVLESLAGREGRNGLGRDLDFLAVYGAASGTRLALARHERAEADDLDTIPLGNARDDRIEHRVDRFAAAEIARLGGGLNEVGFRNHGWHTFSISARSRAGHLPVLPRCALASRASTHRSESATRIQRARVISRTTITKQ